MKFRLMIKLFLRKFIALPSFCKICGIEIRDFSAPDWIWKTIANSIPHGNTLCYNCFCDMCQEYGIKTIWQLEESQEEKKKRQQLYAMGHNKMEFEEFLIKELKYIHAAKKGAK